MKPIVWVALATLVTVGLGVIVAPSYRPRSVVRVARPSPQLEEAIMEARATLPQFKRELAPATLKKRFAIRARFQTEAGPEYLWVRDPLLIGGIFVGILDETPMAYRKFKKGDHVGVPEVDVVDWLILEGDRRRGGLTEDALLETSDRK